MSAHSFMITLKLSVDRPDIPEAMHRDNGTSVVDSELKKRLQALYHGKIADCSLIRKTDLHFNPNEASHRNGVRERMIRTTRRILASITHQHVVNEEALLSWVVETEPIIDSRPVVPIYGNSQNPRILGPNALLLLQPNKDPLNKEFTVRALYRKLETYRTSRIHGSEAVATRTSPRCKIITRGSLAHVILIQEMSSLSLSRELIKLIYGNPAHA
ncbi:uncharacterized protein DEA37_0000446 [Paragonimus westermani]|uniref:Integrase catalytic domain-containing protein n=1 Tax=Paragonimus westermani TaxID=34504 RepID=A0A5J4N3R4_9TREM|nr:uncharacterized protein DEA37_0004839 [Paragonimus westermani]KAA3670068.1 uncharacterized protein DEA37_0000446 [Paragonimus westermani]